MPVKAVLISMLLYTVVQKVFLGAIQDIVVLSLIVATRFFNYHYQDRYSFFIYTHIFYF